MSVFSANGLIVSDNGQVVSSTQGDSAVNNWSLIIGPTTVYADEAQAIAAKVGFYLVTGGALSYTSPSGVTVSGAGYVIGNGTAANTIAVASTALSLVQAQQFYQLVSQHVVTDPSI